MIEIRMRSACLAMIFAMNPAFAADSIKILTGGPSSEKKIISSMAELHKLVKVPIEVTVARRENSVAALIHDRVDAIASGPLEEVIAFAQKNGMGNLNPMDYQARPLSRSTVRVAVHPENPIQSISKEQIAAVLDGRISRWESLGAGKGPITVLAARNYAVVQKGLEDHFLRGRSSPVMHFVSDRDGLLFAIQKNKNAIAFFTEKAGHSDFTPKFFDTHVELQTYLVMKKKSHASAQAVFDYLTR